MSILTGIETSVEQLAMRIPRLTHAEAERLSQTEYERTLALLESLEGEDWLQPTYCTAWTVRDMAAHLAGAVTGSTTFAEFWRQNVSNPYLKGVDDPVDGINRLQVEERLHKSTGEVVAEFRRNGQIAVHNRHKLPWLVRTIHLPMGTLGFAPIEYLMDTIYPRDQWMHRYDICAATGKKMVVTPEHDGRIVALVVLDIAKKLKRPLAQHSVALYLRGEIEGVFLFGRPSTRNCRLEMDVFDFNLRASRRLSVEEATKCANISGDHATGHWFLSHLEVPY
ncbi:MAG TPA: maleylpyruvate isomerase family mycothiol-dependent enzyme [Caldilineaceae bacterium]|nr:maleylpyruvate isomerase family mycothiol-dependent enzyme [Caldilineaceae bacterium]